MEHPEALRVRRILIHAIRVDRLAEARFAIDGGWTLEQFQQYLASIAEPSRIEL